MKITYNDYGKVKVKDLLDISLTCGITYDTARLLYARGIDTVEKAKKYLSAGKNGFINPFLIKGIDKAVERLIKARVHGENVLIFGDYDADGITSVAILYQALQFFGINAVYAIPERKDGYGLNKNIVLDIDKTTPISLIVTVDCGISDFDAIKELQELGKEVIVTDHHEPHETLPDCVCINPKIKESSPFTYYSGAGVAYKLAKALIGNKADEYLDLVALSTIADSMELVGENRDMVTEGLKIFNRNLRPCFKYLISDKTKNINSQVLAYQIAPRVNAGGRMGDATCALKLFLTKDENEMYDLAVKLNEYNIKRQELCDKIYVNTKNTIKKNGYENDEVILVYDEALTTGLIGIIAARLCEDYSRPVIAFADGEGFLKGSARSIEDINIHQVVSCAEDILLSFGGHSQAAGVSVLPENFNELRTRLNDYVKQNYKDVSHEKTVNVEWEITEEISSDFAKEIDLLEPFGNGNKKPLFSTKIKSEKIKLLKPNSNHYSFNTKAMEILAFNADKKINQIQLPIEKEVVFEVNVSYFKGKESIKGYMRGVNYDCQDFSSLYYDIVENEIERLKTDAVVSSVKKAEKLEYEGITEYVISNGKNLNKYPSLSGLNVYYKNAEKNNFSCIVVSPEEIDGNFDRVVYLDKPLQYLNTDKDCYGFEENGCEFINAVSVKREDFETTYQKLKAHLGKEFVNCYQFYNAYEFSVNYETFVFIFKVFEELGFFSIKNNVLKNNTEIRAELTQSKTYLKILRLAKND